MPKIRAAKSYTEAYLSYKEVKACVGKIVELYPETEVAVKINANQIKIENIGLTELNRLEKELEVLAAAEQNPLECAKFCAFTINDMSIIPEIAGTYLLCQQNEKAVSLLKEAIEGQEIKEDNKAWFLTIIDQLIEAGSNDTAITLLNSTWAKETKVLALYSAKAGAIDSAIEHTVSLDSKDLPPILLEILRKTFDSNYSGEKRKKYIFEELEKIALTSLEMAEIIKLLADANERDE